jgi:uracil-DNA glycosylase
MDGLFDLRAYGRDSMPVKKIAECGRCGLAQTCISPKMQPSGEGRTKILFIGDFPSTEDDRQGAHLQEEDGDFLLEILNRLVPGIRMRFYSELKMESL